MTFLPPARRESAVFQMTAMVDVVFILLAFFVMASEFRLPERDVTMGHGEARPLAEGAAAEDFPSSIPVRLRRGAAGVRITIARARLADNDFDAIRAKLTEINMPAITVRIQAEADLAVGQVARAIDAVLASPMKKLSVSKLVVSRPPP
jgi:biopolymer transport protein ExbD